MPDEEKVSLREVVASKMAGMGTQGKPSMSEVKSKMRDIDTVQQTIESAKVLAGTDGLSRQIEEERARLEKANTERDTLRETLMTTQLDGVKDLMNVQLERMREQMGSGNQKGVLDTLKEFNEAAEILGMRSQSPSNGLDQIRNALDLVSQLAPPQKPLSEQIKEILDMNEYLHNSVGGTGVAPAQSTELESAKLQLEMLKMQQAFNLQLEQLKLQGEQSKREFDLKMLEFQDGRQARKDEIQAKISADKERTGIMANGIELLGGAIARATQEFAAAGPRPSVEQSGIAAAARNPVQASAKGAASAKMGPTLQASIGESGAINCPSCETELFLAGDSTELHCTGCGATMPVQRLDEAHGLE